MPELDIGGNRAALIATPTRADIPPMERERKREKSQQEM